MSEFDEYAETRRAELLADAIARRGSGSYGPTGVSGDTSTLTAAQKKIAAEQEFASKQFINSLTGLAGSLNNGTQGMSAYNGVISAGSGVFKAALGGLGQLGTLAGKVAGSLGSYVQLVNKQTDALAKSYQDISTVGAGGKQGLQGVLTTMQQFGLGIAELGKFDTIVKENSASLADFGGTVQQGLKSFGNIAEGIQRTGLQTELLNLGLSTDAINKGLGGFLKTTTMLGNSTRLLSMTQAQQAKAASDYIKQQDIITKLTGATADQQQKSLEAALSNDRFAADRFLKEQKITELKAAGQTDEANRLQEQLTKEDTIRNKLQGSMRQGYEDFVAGAGAQTEAGRAFMNSIGQQGISALRDQSKNAGAAFEIVSDQTKATMIQFGKTITQTGRSEFLPAFKDMMLVTGSMMNKGSVTTAGDQQKDQINNPELALANYNAMIQKQQDITKEFQNLIQLGMVPVGKAMLTSTEIIEGMSRKIPGAGGMPREASQAYITNKEQTERGDTEFLARRNKRSDLIDPRLMDGIKNDLQDDAIKLKTFYHEFVNSLSTKFVEMKQELDNLVNRRGIPTSGTNNTAQLSMDQVAALGNTQRTTGLSMASLLSEMRNLGGPKNDYNSSLDAGYAPLVNMVDTKEGSTMASTPEQTTRDQITAFNTMTGKLDEMIKLLSKSVTIQGDTLRATYN